MTRVAHSVLPAIAIACLLPTTAAQSTYTIPPGYDTRPGNSLDQEPFGLDQIRQLTYVDVSYLVGLPVRSMLKEIRYRRDENRLDKIFSNYEPMRRGTAVIPRWELRLGASTVARSRLTPVYPNIRNLTTVFAGSLNLQVNTPTLSPPANPSTPAPFAMRFPFLVPWQYPGANLIVDHYSYASRNRQHIYYVDSVESQPNNGGEVDLISPTSLGCPANFNRIHGTAPNPGAGSVDLHLFGAPTNAPALCYFGGTTQVVNLAALGLAACNLYTDLTVPVPARTNVAGIATLRFAVPGLSQLLGASIYNQWGVADQRVNPAMGFAMSDGVKVTLGNRIGAETIRMSVISGEGQRANARGGYFQPNRGPVFQLVY